MKFYIETYGCQANKSDSEIITAILKSNHHQSTTDSSRAEIIILNTCYVKQSTQNRIINKLRQLQSQTTLNTQIQNKNTNKQEQYNPNKNKVKKCGALPSRLTTSKIIVVAGCMPEIEPKRIKQILPDAILVSPRQVHKIA
ncbi:MAG: hypothetical protein KKG60_03610, partial [Nanoarchaeota archaeon]|nr:hypothetical protein [Nanoarchaeota archaeon]